MTAEPPQRPSPVFLALHLAVALFGLGLTVVGAIYLYLAAEQSTWLSVRATVTDVAVSQHRRISGNRGQSVLYWELAVSYEYEVGGQRYQGRRYAVGHDAQEIGEEREANERAEALRRSGSVLVYYDPNRPDQAVIEREDYTALVPIGVGLLAAAAGAWLARAHLRKRRLYRGWLQQHPEYAVL